MIHAVAPEILLPVEKKPCYIMGSGLRQLPTLAAVVRQDGKIVGEGVGKDTYEIVQSVEAFEWGQQLSGLSGAPLVSAGLIRDGRQFFFTYRLGESEVRGEKFQRHLSIVSSHDGSLSLQALHSTTVIVCANTLAVALHNGKNRVLIKHTASAVDRMTQAVAALEVAAERTSQENILIEALMMRRVTTTDLLDGLLPKPGDDAAAKTKTQVANARTAIRKLTTAQFVDGFEGTGWAWVQAVNSYEQWSQPTRKPKGFQGSDADLRALRQFDAMVKGAQPLTAKAVELVMAS
jgi:phage/plasmid-like protein (TIGR03299 family)